MKKSGFLEEENKLEKANRFRWEIPVEKPKEHR